MVQSHRADKNRDQYLVQHLLLANNDFAHLHKDLLAHHLKALDSFLESCGFLIHSDASDHRFSFPSVRFCGRPLQFKQ